MIWLEDQRMDIIISTTKAALLFPEDSQIFTHFINKMEIINISYKLTHDSSSQTAAYPLTSICVFLLAMKVQIQICFKDKSL